MGGFMRMEAQVVEEMEEMEELCACHEPSRRGDQAGRPAWPKWRRKGGCGGERRWWVLGPFLPGESCRTRLGLTVGGEAVNTPSTYLSPDGERGTPCSSRCDRHTTTHYFL